MNPVVNYSIDLPHYQDHNDLYRMCYSEFEKPALYLALKGGVFELIKSEGALEISKIIEGCKFGKRGGEAIINLITALGFLRCVDGKYTLTESSETYLLSSSPHNWIPLLTHFYELPKYLSEAWERDLKNEKHEKLQVFDPQITKMFLFLMDSFSFSYALAFSKKINLKQMFSINSLLDVAGGSGSFSRAIVTNQPNVKSVILDLPHVCKECEDYIEKSEIPSGSVLTYACDIFKEPYPLYSDPKYGYQAIFMSNVLHDWDDEKCIFLCKKAFDSLPSGGTIILHEMLFHEDGHGSLKAAYMSFCMFARTEGRQFKYSELKNFLEKVGFINVGCVETYNDYFAIYGQKA